MIAKGFYPSIAYLADDEWPWPHFSPEEVVCKGSGRLIIVPSFMDHLELLREEFDKPMVIYSWYRAPWYNRQISDSGLDGPHTTGKAIDVKVTNATDYRLLQLAFKYGFTGIGVGLKDGFVHMDYDLEASHPRSAVWVY